MNLANYKIRPFLLGVHGMPEKSANILKHFREEGIDDVEVFNGFNAKECGLRTIHNYERDAPGQGWNIGVKPVAVFVSQFMLYSAMNVCSDTHFLQLEWDTHLLPDWRKLSEQALRDVPPDFDLLFLGSCCCQPMPKKLVKGEVWNVQYPQCGHMLLIAKKALPVMLENLTKVYAPMDIALALHVLPLLKVYTVLPRVAEQFNTVLQP